MAIGLRELKKTRTRNQIVDVLIDLIKERGYEDATVDEICTRTEITAPTFYNYFSSKEAVLGYFYTETIRHIRLAMEEQRDEALSFEAKLRGFAHRLSADSLENSALWKALMLYGGNNLASDSTRKAASSEIESTYVGIFKEGQESGEIRSDYSAALLSTVFDGAMYMIGFRWASGVIPDDRLEQAFQDAIDVCLAGMNP